MLTLIFIYISKLVVLILVFTMLIFLCLYFCLVFLTSRTTAVKGAIMGHINITLFELILLSIIFGQTIAVIETQEQVPANENPQNLGNIISLTEPSSSSAAKVLSESAVPGKNSRYIIRFARTPSSIIRFSRSPSSQIRFGRSQPFVRFGRSNELNNDYGSRAINYLSGTGFGPADKLVRFGQNGANDENIPIEPRSSGESGFIRQTFVPTPLKSDALRAINWKNFLRLGRNNNANIRFAGKRDGSDSGTNHFNVIPIEMLLEKMAQQKQQLHTSNSVDIPNERNIVNEDDQTPFDGSVTNTDQYQTMYSNGGNDLEQR